MRLVVRRPARWGMMGAQHGSTLDGRREMSKGKHALFAALVVAAIAALTVATTAPARTDASPTIKARLPASVSLQRGETVGLSFRGSRLSIFQKTSGRAVRTLRHRGASDG